MNATLVGDFGVYIICIDGWTTKNGPRGCMTQSINLKKGI